jgi:hypothetical protein
LNGLNPRIPISHDTILREVVRYIANAGTGHLLEIVFLAIPLALWTKNLQTLAEVMGNI